MGKSGSGFSLREGSRDYMEKVPFWQEEQCDPGENRQPCALCPERELEPC